MCPLRILLIFLSATLAGFFVLRSLGTNSEEEEEEEEEGKGGGAEEERIRSNAQFQEQTSCFAKFRSAVSCGFWTCVDMASGRYLWRNLVSNPQSGSAATAAASLSPKKQERSKKKQ